MKLLIKPRLQKDKWSLYWKTSMATKTELLDEFTLELDDAAGAPTVAAMKAAVGAALGWAPVGSLLRLEGFEEPWELFVHKGMELPAEASLAAAGVPDGGVVVAVRKVLVAEGAAARERARRAAPRRAPV
jgi:hypothetical protein